MIREAWSFCTVQCLRPATWILEDLDDRDDVEVAEEAEITASRYGSRYSSRVYFRNGKRGWNEEEITF